MCDVQLNSLLSKGLSKTAVDRPINVDGCYAASNPAARGGGEAFPGGAGRRETLPRAGENDHPPNPWRHPRPSKKRRKAADTRQGNGHGNGHGDGCGGATALSLEELSPPFFGDRGAAAFSPPPPSRARLSGTDLGLGLGPGLGVPLDRQENANVDVHVDGSAGVVARGYHPESVPQGNSNSSSSSSSSSLPASPSPPKRNIKVALPTVSPVPHET